VIHVRRIGDLNGENVIVNKQRANYVLFGVSDVIVIGDGVQLGQDGHLMFFCSNVQIRAFCYDRANVMREDVRHFWNHRMCFYCQSLLAVYSRGAFGQGVREAKREHFTYIYISLH
jgi:hypothetical protein